MRLLETPLRLRFRSGTSPVETPTRRSESGSGEERGGGVGEGR